MALASRPERRRRAPVRSQLALLVPLAVVWGGCVAVLAAVVADHDVDHGVFFLDASTSLGGAWYTGLVSQLGIVAWTLGAAFAVAGAWIASVGGRRGAARFLGLGALLTAWLMLDDLFLLHADLLPRLGAPKRTVELAYVGAIALWLLVSWHEVRRTRLVVLGAAVVAFAASLTVDLYVPGSDAGRRVLFEDGAKFLGVWAWMLWLALTSADIARSVLADLAARPAPRGEPFTVAGTGRTALRRR